MIAHPLVLAVLLAVPQGAGPPAAQNPCVTCHQGLPEPAAAAHSFAEWRGSAHGGVVTCDRCHDGDTTATEPAAAHRGVHRSQDYRSKVYATRIPATCGACHQQQLGFFTESRHYAQLTTSRRGPSCVTCHGSMAIRVLSADEMAATCSTCHGAGQGAPPEAPAEARRLLTVLQQADSALPATEARAGQATVARRAAAMRFVRQAREAAQEARRAWHAFDLTLMEQSASQAAAGVRRADSVLAGRPRR
jgi:hypothetical protein